MAKTNQERLAVVEEKIDSLDKKVDQNHEESKKFHSDLISRLDTLVEDKVKTARLEEKVKTLERGLWTVVTAMVGVIVKMISDLVNK